MDENITVRVTVRCAFTNIEHVEYVHYPRSKWDALSQMKREIRLDMLAQDVLVKVVKVYAEVVG